MLRWLAIIIFLSAAISLLPIKINFHLYRENNRLEIAARFSLWFIPWQFQINNPLTTLMWNLSKNRFWRRSPPGELRASEISWLRVLARLWLFRKVVSPIFKRTRKMLAELWQPIRISEQKLYTEIGLGDAAVTAMSVGVIWSLIGIITGRLRSLYNLQNSKNNFRVIPNYEKENYLLLDYFCIFEMRLGHIIIVIYQVLRSAESIHKLIKEVSQ